MSYTKRRCDYCNEVYEADSRNLLRGWDLCCSKSCAAKKREADKLKRGTQPPKPDPRGLQFIKNTLQSRGVGFETEYRFHEKRQFRFDVAIPDKRIAIEYEGIYSSTSRHTTLDGYSKDCDKYNLAAVRGWRVLRFTSKNYLTFSELIAVLYP